MSWFQNKQQMTHVFFERFRRKKIQLNVSVEVANDEDDDNDNDEDDELVFLNIWNIQNMSHVFPAGNCMFKVNNGNTRARCET